MLSKEDFQDAMARFTAAVTIVTTTDDGEPVGLVATSVCSLSAEPPSLIACINKNTSAHDPILRNRIFAVNLLADSQAHLVRHFMGKKGPERFDAGAWDSMITGAPVVNGAVAVFDCELTNACDGFSHTILIGRIIGMRIASDEDQGACLLWHRREFAKVASYSQS